jgi:hypothetical protein
MVGRHPRPVAPCDGARAVLVTWLRDEVDEHYQSYASLSDDIRYDRSAVSRALSGHVMPPQRLVLLIAEKCGASADTAERLWAAADANRRQRPAREADGHPLSTSPTTPHSSMGCGICSIDEGSRSGSWYGVTSPGCCAARLSVRTCGWSVPCHAR